MQWRPFLRRLLNAVLTCFLILCLGFGAFYYESIYAPSLSQDRCPGIVVLTGGNFRVREGFKLLQKFPKSLLFISGVTEGAKARELWRAAFQGERVAFQKQMDHQITLGDKAKTTRGNMIEILPWLEANKISRVCLVTSDYHMIRSRLEFKKMTKVIEVNPHPVRTELTRYRLWIIEYFKSLIVLATFFLGDRYE